MRIAWAPSKGAYFVLCEVTTTNQPTKRVLRRIRPTFRPTSLTVPQPSRPGTSGAQIDLPARFPSSFEQRLPVRRRLSVGIGHADRVGRHGISVVGSNDLAGRRRCRAVVFCRSRPARGERISLPARPAVDPARWCMRPPGSCTARRIDRREKAVRRGSRFRSACLRA